MRDSFNRTIEYLRVSLTPDCNLRCIYCMPENGCGWKNKSLTQAEFWRLIKLICTLGIKKIRLTGGEPLLYPNLADLIRKIKTSTQVDEIALTTNGILLEQKAEQLKKAGLDSINVSLDCLNEALFARITRGGEVGRVLSGMDKARKAGMKLKINSVILRGINEQEIVPLADFAQRTSVLLRFIELMPINVAQKYQGQEEAAVLQRLTAVFGEKSLMAENSSPAHYYKFAAAQMPIGFISALSHKFCARCNRIRLTAAGFLKPCLHDRGGRDLKILLSEGASDEQIVQAIRETVYQKPCSHHLTEASFAQRETQSMSLIGG